MDHNKIEPRTLVDIVSNSIGDNIGAIAVIDKWRRITGKKIGVISSYPELIRKSYPDILIYKKSDINVEISPEKSIWRINDLLYTEKISTTYKFEVPLLTGYAKDFGIDDISDIEIKVDNFAGDRPLRGKYVCIGVHSTSQCKYWNYPDAWNELCKLLRRKNLTPVCIERDYSFGIKGYMNDVPNRSLKKLGMSFNDILNYINHSEMFIGLSSGLSWISQGLNKPTVIISNVTSKDNEYVNDKTLRIYNENVCHGCFHKYPFNASDWLWCPVYRNDESRRFICTKSITPESVMEKIEKIFNI